MKRILLCARVDGKAEATVDGAALLLGVSPDELRAVWNPGTGADNLPDALQRKGQKRAKTARDAMGTDTMTVCLAYWAMYAWACRIDFDEAAGEMWAVIDGEDPS